MEVIWGEASHVVRIPCSIKCLTDRAVRCNQRLNCTLDPAWVWDWEETETICASETPPFRHTLVLTSTLSWKEKATASSFPPQEIPTESWAEPDRDETRTVLLFWISSQSYLQSSFWSLDCHAVLVGLCYMTWPWCSHSNAHQTALFPEFVARPRSKVVESLWSITCCEVPLWKVQKPSLSIAQKFA